MIRDMEKAEIMKEVANSLLEYLHDSLWNGVTSRFSVWCEGKFQECESECISLAESIDETAETLCRKIDEYGRNNAIRAVVGQIENMLYDELMSESGCSNFEYWCEEQFYGRDDEQECYSIAEDLAESVNQIEWTLAQYADME